MWIAEFHGTECVVLGPHWFSRLDLCFGIHTLSRQVLYQPHTCWYSKHMVHLLIDSHVYVASPILSKYGTTTSAIYTRSIAR